MGRGMRRELTVDVIWQSWLFFTKRRVLPAWSEADYTVFSSSCLTCERSSYISAMVDQGEQKIIELGYRRLCSDATLQSTKEGFFKDYLINVTEQITPDEFEEFSRKNKDHDRVLFIWTLSAYHTTLKRVQPIYRTKSSEESRIRRETGNVAFKNKEYKSALFSYSQSVIYASYGKRSPSYNSLSQDCGQWRDGRGLVST